MKKIEKAIACLIIMSVMIAPIGAFASTNEIGFIDVKTSDWYYGPITTLLNEGIILPRGNGQFLPDKKITMGEFARTLTIAFYPEDNITVNNESWARDYLQEMKDKGILTDAEIGTANGSDFVQRQVAIAAIMKAKGTILVSGDCTQYLMKFTDANIIGSEYVSYMATGIVDEYICGCSYDSLAPTAFLTKAEFCKILCGIYQA